MTTAAPSASAVDHEAAELAAHLRAIMVAVRSRAGGGSGTVWGRDGLIVTNHHVVPGETADILTHDERRLPARVVARDPSRDVAALRVEATFATVAEPRATNTVRAGELAFAMGNPWGEPGVLTRGVVVSRGPATIENNVPLDEAIRADVRLAPGNSGGPLADAAGRVLGVNSMIAGGMAIAVPADAVVAFLEGDGSGFLGITTRVVRAPAAVAAAYRDDEEAALLLTDIIPGSPASRAGLLPGDLILRLDGELGLGRVARRLQRMRPGRPVRIEVLRGGAIHETTAEPVTRA